MKSYQKILVGINYSASCEVALRQAHRIAQISGGSVQAFHAISASKIDDVVNFYGMARAIMISGAASSLEAFVERTLGSDHGVTCQVDEGIPHHELMNITNESDADLLILGANEYAPTPNRAGKFAIKCLRFAYIPVLIIRHHSEQDFNSLCACIDFSKSTASVLQHAAQMVTSPAPRIELVHAACPPWLQKHMSFYGPELYADPDQEEQFHEIMNGQMHGTVSLSKTLFPTQPQPVYLEHRDPEVAIIEHLKSSHCELAVIGRSGKGAHGLKTDLLGGTAEALIRHADCSVLIVPITD